jgi:hypothetical protein
VKRGLLLLKALSVIIFLSNSVYSDTYTFTQNTPFVFQGATGSSVIFASGMIGNVTDVNITLNGLKVNNFFQGVSEIDVLLVGPQGQKIILLSYVCQFETSPGPFDFTFDGAATGTLPSGISGMSCVSGTYLASDYHDLTPVGYILDTPAPPPPYSTNLADLNNVNPTGNWTLYAAEDEGNEGGTIDSWTITIETDEVPPSCMYEEQFNDGMLTYTAVKPIVQETAGSLVLTPTSKKAYSTSDASFAGIQNGTITAELMFSTNGALIEKGLMLTHWVDKKHLMEIQFNIARKKVIVKQKNGTVRAKAKGNFTFDFDTPYTVAATYTGSVYEVRINNTLVVTLTPVGSIPSGILGFQAVGLTESVNQVCVAP